MANHVNSDGAPRRPRWRWIAQGGAVGLLLLPFVAMHFTDEVNWTAFDFLVFGAMLAAALGTVELAVRKTPNTAYRAAAGVAVAAAFLLVWINGAVGIIGSENHPANLMFAGVLAVAVLGALIARFQPRGMARALVVAAAAQLLVGVIAALAGLGNIFPITGAFAALWLTSAALFRRAAA
jgi:hypothetical protein